MLWEGRQHVMLLALVDFRLEQAVPLQSFCSTSLNKAPTTLMGQKIWYTIMSVLSTEHEISAWSNLWLMMLTLQNDIHFRSQFNSTQYPSLHENRRHRTYFLDALECRGISTALQQQVTKRKMAQWHISSHCGVDISNNIGRPSSPITEYCTPVLSPYFISDTILL